MKTKEELNTIKEEVETLSKKLRELTEDELKQVTGGGWYPYRDDKGHINFSCTVKPKACDIGTASGEYGLIEINSDPGLS